MRNRLAQSTIFLVVIVAVSSSAFAQAQRPAQAAQSKAAAPAPVRDINGVWAGPVQARMNTTPPLTDLGQKLFSANQALGGVSQSKIAIVSAGVSNDPAQKCDPYDEVRDTFLDSAIGMN